MPNIAKLHHTVPKFYLRGFADMDERITTVRLPGDKRFTQVIGKTAATNHFYTVQDHPEGPDVIEKALAAVESSAASIFRSIVDGVWPLPEEQRLELGYFLAMQAVRGPDQRKMLGHMLAQMARLEAMAASGDRARPWAKRRLGLDLNDEQAARYREQAANPQGPYRVPAPVHIKQMAELPEKLVKYLVGRPWTLVRFDKRSLITNDAPVGLVRQPEDGATEMGVGFMTAWGITFPVTRKLGLVMSDIAPLVEAGVPVERVWSGAFDVAQEGSTAYEKLINETTVDMASECIYHHPDDKKYVPEPLPEATYANGYGDE
ncbi:DUF4238 domain-containing protein [Williamsia maris]|uniref:DUF4238 domain-containing protein n=1 Tax=Williamsia maris TaxID=72806 RepID=A0ABT1HL85_9NOCA|nr:DUF4238 domain-containing protein [Williamsia maris]MCP2178690.1 Protein of unknown function (DUF4238) [Williamsia maris]